MTKVVIGIDGSAQAEQALRRGLQEALRFGAGAVVVHAWLPTPYSANLPWFAAPYPAAIQEHIDKDREAAAAEMRRRVAEIQSEEGAGAVEITYVTRVGMVATVLLEEAAGAHTLVVGARGHGGFPGLLVGSAADQCVRHAVCPVLVVPAGPAAEASLPASLNR
jgi:nucleotide-binding universal stress UspA family protein